VTIATHHDKKVPMPRIAVIGTGTMGTAMALRLLGAGMEVDVWSRHAASTRPLTVAGATAHKEASEAVQRAAVTITMLPNAEITADVMVKGNVIHAMAPDSIWIQMATIGADATERLAAETQHRRPDLVFVDAPVSGSRDPAGTTPRGGGARASLHRAGACHPLARARWRWEPHEARLEHLACLPGGGGRRGGRACRTPRSTGPRSHGCAPRQPARLAVCPGKVGQDVGRRRSCRFLARPRAERP
jgi:hypothetical protein